MKFLSYGVMTYTLMALIWWSVLLTRTNKSLFETRKEFIELKNKVSDSDSTSEIATVEKDYIRNKWMIIGEGSVFGILLIIGMWFIQRAYQKDIRATTKQKNFLLSITHELKSPLAAIGLMMETLIKRNLEKDKQIELHQNVLSETHRLEKLIHNLLLSAKLDEGYHYNFEAHNIQEIIEKICQHYRNQFPEISIGLNIKSEILPIELDREAIQSMINNIIENSIKYSANEIKILIELYQSKTTTIISCADNGVGIPDNEKNRITEQFYRIGNEETRNSKGTGLGLNIVQQLIKAHKGELKFEDNTPSGLKVIVTLPNKIIE